jgi:glycosyltransferase involved in cell wall biosynthesis
MTDIAIAHWGEHCDGGGERVGWELARQFDTPLYVGRRDPSIEPDDVEVRQLHDGLVGQLIERGGLAQMATQQVAWEIAEPLRDADVLITSGNEPLAYVPPAEQTWVHYVHHTSRWATDLLPHLQEKDYGRLSRPKRLAERLVRKAERQLYARYARKPDLIVANSEMIARRVRCYWGVPMANIAVVHPPVPVNDYSPDHARTGDYYLSLSRLDWHKALDGVVDAFAGTDLPLKIAGDGQEREALEAQADGHKNIELLGYVDEEDKHELIAGAKGFIVNAFAEDFGITTVEALASGTPVLGVAEGMTQHLVRDGKTGYTYDRGELRKAVRRLDAGGVSKSEHEIAAWADRFDAGRFGHEMELVVDEAQDLARVGVVWGDEGAETGTAEREAVADGGGR